jgi:hypothetical protein
VTDLGDVDLVPAPAGFPRGYDELVDHAIAIDLGDGVSTWMSESRRFWWRCHAVSASGEHRLSCTVGR